MSDSQLQTEHSTLLEEYKAIKSEIISNLDSGRQVTSLTLTTIGVLIAATPFIIQSQANILFLIAPLLFYGLAWTQLRYVYFVLDMGAYLREIIRPRVHQILIDLSPTQQRDFSQIMGWELAGKGPTRLRQNRLMGILFLPIAGANFGIPLLAAALSVCTFLILAFQTSRPISSMELILIVVDAVVFAYSGFWGVQAELRR